MDYNLHNNTPKLEKEERETCIEGSIISLKIAQEIHFCYSIIIIE